MSKVLIHRPWLRRSIWTVVSVASLVILFVSFVNWRGARLKRGAVGRLRSAGLLPENGEGVMPSMPPERENMAMIPLLREPAPDSPAASFPGSGSPWGPEGRRAALYDPVFGLLRADREGNLDFSRMPAEAPYGRTAADFLGSYDRLNAKAMEELREGLMRPFARRPLYFMTLPQAPLENLGDKLGISLRASGSGLGTRGRAALACGNPETAVESIIMGLRLAELEASRGPSLSLLIAPGVRGPARAVIREGIRQHVFDEPQLRAIQAELRRTDHRQAALTALRLEALHLNEWSRWTEVPSYYASHLELFINLADTNLHQWLARKGMIGLLPAGCIDSQAALWANCLAHVYTTAAQPGPLSQWLSVARDPQDDKTSQAYQEAAEIRAILFVSIRSAVLQSQDILACELEVYRLKSGSYPSDLGPLSAPLTQDPLTGGSFGYHLKDDSFVLYSIGPDGVDQGGDDKRPRETDADAPDWVW